MHRSDFSLFGRSPAQVVVPTSVEEVQQVVRDAAGQGIVPWGGGTRQHIGYPPERYDLALSTASLNAVTDYQPADLTITAQAGVSLAQLQTALAQHGQWLPLEIAQPERQTLGGIVASRPHSLSRARNGSVRDSLIGLTVINHLGEAVRGGGKVVKNVSGYDLPKLYCGSWGTLGLIAEVTFKVSPRPEAQALCVVPLPAGRNAEEVLDHLLGSALEPTFLFLLNPSAAREALGEADAAQQYLLLGFDGLAETVDWQCETLGVTPLPAPEAEAVRARLRDFSGLEVPFTATFHILSSQVGAYARMMEWTARRAGFAASVAADAALGILHVHVRPERDDADWTIYYADFADKAARVGGSCTIEQMPAELRALDAPVWLPLLPDFRLMTRLKETLDPPRMWNPGRFVGRL